MNKKNLLAFATFIGDKDNKITGKADNRGSNIGKFYKKDKSVLVYMFFISNLLKQNLSSTFVNSDTLK